MTAGATMGGLPSAAQVSRELAKIGRAGATAAGAIGLAEVKAQAPRKSGQLAGAFDVKVRKRGDEHTAYVRTASGAGHGHVSASAVSRWVTRGTGLYRTTGTDITEVGVIRAKRKAGAMVLPGGKRVRTVKGQRPNPFMARAQYAAEPAAHAAMEAAADQGAVKLASTFAKAGRS